MKTQQLIRKLEKLHQKNDEDGALKLIDEVPDDALPLYAVISSGWVELIDRLDYMRHCEMYDTPDADGNLALHLAAQQGPQMLRAVLAQGIDAGLFEFNDEEYTPAMIAASRGDVDCLRLLARAGADFDQAGENLGRTALESACWSGKLETVQYLLDAGADASLVELDVLEQEEGYEDAIAMIEEAAELRNGMDRQRFKTIEVSMGAGEADFVMPAKLEQSSDLFIADVIGDLHADTDRVRLERGERFFGDAPNAAGAAKMLGLGDVAERINRKRQIAAAEQAPAPKGKRPH